MLKQETRTGRTNCDRANRISSGRKILRRLYINMHFISVAQNGRYILQMKWVNCLGLMVVSKIQLDLGSSGLVTSQGSSDVKNVPFVTKKSTSTNKNISAKTVRANCWNKCARVLLMNASK